eukprot:TRINITY_DN5158_c0_g1_i3.p1 TRINITY_DN5158_c0_g1~~TRINITY_DN5158_c0_g1_i3.p1  ORF type:complete len:378 (-),score=50.09 TRINITY_DN5158_c0_g1_i3:360-1493(-)
METMGTLDVMLCKANKHGERGEPPCKHDSGDGQRTPENYGLVANQWIFWFLHNHICNTLYDNYGCTEDEECFQLCRKISIAIYQHINYNEFLPLLVGHKWMKKYGLYPTNGYTKYNSKVNPTTSNVFSTAAKRYGHAMVPGFFEIRCPDYPSKVYYEDLHEVIFSDLDHPIECILFGQINQPAHIKGPSMTGDLTNKLFMRHTGIGNDLATFNIFRGRDHGIPSFNKWRKFCGFHPINTWEEAYKVLIPETVEKFKRLYVTPEDLDLWSAGLSEQCEPGALVGPTFSCLMSLQFANYKYGDRFYYEHEGQFSPAQLHAIREVKMSTLICLLTEGLVTKIQPWAFVLPDYKKNAITYCEDLPQLDLSPWIDSSSRGPL